MDAFQVLDISEFDPERQAGKLLIKAATYHQLRMEEKKGRWEIDVIFDI